MSLLRNNNRFPKYKPLRYEWAYKGYELLQDQHWKAKEISLAQDVVDYHRLPPKQQNMIKNILRLFTQNDIEALTGYSALLGSIKPTEVKMWLSAVANTEAIHIDAYSLLTDTLGFDETFYDEFVEIPVMERKIDFLEKAKAKKYHEYKALGLSEADIDKTYRRDVTMMVGVFGGGLEGIELMAQFALLLAWQELGQFNGMSQINTYSILDENIHQIFNSMLYLTLKEENEDVMDEEAINTVRQALIQASQQELALIDYLYSDGEHPTVTEGEAKQYVKFMTDRALKMLDLQPHYGVEKNPLSFMNDILSNVHLANFFEVDVTEYSKNLFTTPLETVDTKRIDWESLHRQTFSD